jgi:CSLREA domain-containing protein
MLPAEAGLVLVVDSTADTSDANPGDGLCDDGFDACTLRAAIDEANASPGHDTISFSIGTGVQTITPNTPLPTIFSDPVTIDGTTQAGYAGNPIIELNGEIAGMDADGLVLVAGDTTIRGLVINRFDRAGIEVNSGRNVIQGNYIGTDVTGNSDLGNEDAGVQISDSSNNVIGGTVVGARNVISGNGILLTGFGVRIIGENSTGNLVQGNFIGTNAAGTAGIYNGNGIEIDGASSNTIGGASAAARNIISGNNGQGVRIFGGNFNELQGNYIGLDVSGSGWLGNTSYGVLLDRGASFNSIGGSAPGSGNVISGNVAGGIDIYGGTAPSAQNRIHGNHIGTNATGDGPIGNGFGIRIGFSAGNVIGGADADSRNVISGNFGDGVFIVGNTATANSVLGNFIGLDAAGTVALGNRGVGVEIANAPRNVIGGMTASSGNVISGNTQNGIGIDFVEATGNTITSNFIGTDVTGLRDLGNAEDGINIDSASNNTIEGTESGAGNLISGNDAHGVNIVGTVFDSSSGTTIQGNFVGTDASGTADLGNRFAGIRISEAVNTLVGGTTPSMRNVISGNDADGVGIACCNGTGNQIQGNYIGLNASGTAALGNSSYGVVVFAPGNVVGGAIAGAGNTISGNAPAGVFIIGSDNAVEGNFLGTSATGESPVGNAMDGVLIQGGIGNSVGGTDAGSGNTIAFNGRDGVRVEGDIEANQATVRGNSIHTNGAKGIETTDGGNGELTPPTIDSAGSASGTACAACIVDVYSDNEDEGRVYHGSTTADTNGNWSFAGAIVGPNVTATATDALGTTSEFSTPFACLDEDADGMCNSGDPSPLGECAGQAVTVLGTDGPDSLVGTPSVDVIDGAGGDDVIRGGGGDDVVCGGSGNDLIDGQGGDDSIYGEDGDDRLEGDKGADSLDGGPGSDRCFGGAGIDAAANCEKRSSIP